MTRECVNGEPGQWAMFCNRCRNRDPDITPQQQSLRIYRDRGWWIADAYVGDLCPTCVTQVPEAERAKPFDFDRLDHSWEARRAAPCGQVAS